MQASGMEEVMENSPSVSQRELKVSKDLSIGASLVAQWLGVRLLMQGTWVRAPVREDPICRRAAGPVSHGR